MKNNSNLNTIPVLKTTILLIIGFILSGYFPIDLTILFILTTILLVTSFILYFFYHKISFILGLFLGLTIVTAGMLRYQIKVNVFPENHIRNYAGIKDKVAVLGYVANYPIYANNKTTFELETKMLAYQDSVFINTVGKILVNYKDTAHYVIRKGDEVILQGRLRKPPGERNPGEFNYRKYLQSKAIFGIMYISRSANISISSSENQLSWSDKILRVARENIENAINSAFTGQNRAILKSLILGERGEVSSELRDAFSDTGVMHVLAVSGLHVGYVILFFSLLFYLIGVPFRMTTILTMLSLGVYASLVGFKPPVVRATIIAELYFFGQLIQRNTNPLNLLATAALIILIINPAELYQASFQLSFVAVLAIFYLYRILNDSFDKYRWISYISGRKFLNFFWQLLLVSIAASCGTLPLTMYYFEKLPILSTFLNLVVIPLVMLIIISGFIFLIISQIWWTPALILAKITGYVIIFLNMIVKNAGILPCADVDVFGLTVLHILILYYVIILVFNFNNRSARMIFVISLLIGLNFYTWQNVCKTDKWMEVVFLDVGQGDSALIKLPGKQYVLIDGGIDNEDFNAGQRHVLPYLRRHGIKKLDLIVLTHTDSDHLGGIPYIMRNIPVKRIIDNNMEADSELYQLYQFVTDSLKIPPEYILPGSRIEGFREDCGLFVLNPVKDLVYDSQNNASIVIKLIYKNISFLFTGDIECETEARLLRLGNLLESDVLKLAHHGSHTSSTGAFLNIVKPQYAVISVGEYNRHKHPSDLVINRLKNLNIPAIRTDVNGAIIFRTNGKILKQIK